MMYGIILTPKQGNDNPFERFKLPFEVSEALDKALNLVFDLEPQSMPNWLLMLDSKTGSEASKYIDEALKLCFTKQGEAKELAGGAGGYSQILHILGLLQYYCLQNLDKQLFFYVN